MSVAESLKEFLLDIWGEEENYVYMAIKPTPDTFRVSKSPVSVPANIDRVVEFILAKSTESDTYFTPGTFKPDTTEKKKVNGLRAKALWVDIDGYHEGQGTVEEALKTLNELGLPEPSYRIQSSKPGAEHWYWLLQDYIPAALVNTVNQRIAYALNGDKACWDISHVLRPPFTRNYKEEYDKPEVKIIHADRKRLDVSVFKVVPHVKESLDFIDRPEKLLSRDECEKQYKWKASAYRLADLEKNDFKLFGGKAQRGGAMVKLGYELAEVGASDEVIFSMLYYVDDKWEKFKFRPDRDRYIKDIVLRVRMKYPAMTYSDPGMLFGGAEATEDKELQPFDNVKIIYGFKEFLESEFEYNWLIQDLVPLNSINFVSARPGIGKSRYTLQMACSLGMGIDFLGYPVVDGQKKVVYFSLEMGPPVLKYFIEGVAESMAEEIDLDVLDKNFKLLPMGSPLDLEKQESVQFFKYVMEKEKPDVVLIDALGSLTSEALEEKSSKVISGLLKEWLITYNCTFFMVHHNRKELQNNPNKPPTLGDFYGNTMASTDAATVISLWRGPSDDKNDVQMHIVKGRTVKGDDKKVWLLDGSKMTFTIKGELDEDGKRADNIGDYAAFKPDSPNGGFGLGFLD